MQLSVYFDDKVSIPKCIFLIFSPVWFLFTYVSSHFSRKCLCEDNIFLIGVEDWKSTIILLSTIILYSAGFFLCNISGMVCLFYCKHKHICVCAFCIISVENSGLFCWPGFTRKRTGHPFLDLRFVGLLRVQGQQFSLSTSLI